MQGYSTLTPLEREAVSGDLLDRMDAAVRGLSMVDDQSQVGRDVRDALRLQASLLRTLTGTPRLRLVALDREEG